MTSHRSATPFLRLNGPKSPAKQRPKPVTDSTLALIQSSSPISSQLPETLDSMLPPELPDPWDSPQVLPTEKRPRPTFAQRLAGRSHSQTERSESPCSYRSSQPSIVPRPHALLETPSDSQLDSEIDSQITYDNAEDREERRRAQEASNASKSQRSRPQQKNQQKDQVTTKTKPLSPPEESSYKLNVETFWEGEKAAFDTQTTKRQLLLAHQEPQLFTPKTMSFLCLSIVVPGFVLNCSKRCCC